jgi:hypothetical protein
MSTNRATAVVTAILAALFVSACLLLQTGCASLLVHELIKADIRSERARFAMAERAARQQAIQAGADAIKLYASAGGMAVALDVTNLEALRRGWALRIPALFLDVVAGGAIGESCEWNLGDLFSGSSEDVVNHYHGDYQNAEVHGDGSIDQTTRPTYAHEE